MKKNRGQSVTAVILITASLTGVVNWLTNRILNSPNEAALALTETQDEVTQTRNVLSTLCNDYQQTVSRVDQNMQAIGKALKVNVVAGRADANPCAQLTSKK